MSITRWRFARPNRALICQRSRRASHASHWVRSHGVSSSPAKPFRPCWNAGTRSRLRIETSSSSTPFSTRNTRLRRPAVPERHSSSAHRVRRWNGLSHRRKRFATGLPSHSQNKRRRVAYPSYALGSAWDTIFLFGRARRLQTADMNSFPPLRLARFLHNRAGNGSVLARYKSH